MCEFSIWGLLLGLGLSVGLLLTLFFVLGTWGGAPIWESEEGVE